MIQLFGVKFTKKFEKTKKIIKFSRTHSILTDKVEILYNLYITSIKRTWIMTCWSNTMFTINNFMRALVPSCDNYLLNFLPLDT